MNLKESTAVVGLAVVLSVALALLAVKAPVVNNTVPPATVTQYGAVPSLQSPLEVNGAKKVLQAVKMNKGNKTLCTVKTPGVKSVGTFYFEFISSNADYATGFQAGYGTTAGATTTTLGSVIAVAAGGTGAAIASTTSTIFAADSFINLNYNATNTISSTYAPDGYCVYEGLAY